MSRLAEAETRFADAIKALEAAIESRLAAAVTPAQPDASAAAADGIDPSALRTELARIDEQVSRAMQLISDAQKAELGTAGFGKEGRA